ncbi:MAG: hypothetical protein LBI42_01220 [Chitinispirillales bacterium]|jgi:hypothetical protein|nr:hypothetical protein [Chitinispirillales bacterium]
MQGKTIEHGISMAIRHPEAGVELLARTFARHFQGAPWINGDLKMRFCILFLSNLLDGGVEREVSGRTLEKLVKKTVSFGIRLMKRWPDEGLKMLVAMIMRELKCNQHCSELEQQYFCEEVIAVFFPQEAQKTILAKVL